MPRLQLFMSPRRPWLALLFGLAMVSCSSVVVLPTWSPTSDSALPDALQSGTLTSVGDCVWIETNPRDRTILIWPPGYIAGGSPLSIFDASGQRVATVGEYITVDGGPIPHDPKCGISVFWIVGTVRRQP